MDPAGLDADFRIDFTPAFTDQLVLKLPNLLYNFNKVQNLHQEKLLLEVSLKMCFVSRKL